MRRGVFGRARWARAGREVSRTEGVFWTPGSSGSVCNKRQKSADGTSFGPVLGSESPLIFRPTLRPCHRRDDSEVPAHKGPRKPWHAHRPLQNDRLVTSTLRARYMDVTPLSFEKNLSRAMPCKSRESLVTSCIQSKLPTFRPRNTPVGFAAVCSIFRIMKPRNCPADLLLRAAHIGMFPRPLASRECASFAHDFREATA